MAIDFKDWQMVSPAQSLDASAIQYKTISQDEAWQQLSVWLRGGIEELTSALDQSTQTFQASGDYSYEGLVKQKSLIDLTQARLLSLIDVEAKIDSYTRKDPMQ